MTPQELRSSILQLAIQGKLVEQRPEEGTGEELYRRIQAEKQRLIKAGTIKKEKPFPELTEDEKPFEIPASWIWARISDCGCFISGYTPKPDQLASTGPIPYFKVADMNTDGNELYLSFSSSYMKYTNIKYYLKDTIVYPKNGGAIFTNKKRILAQDSVVDLNTGGFYPFAPLDLMYIYMFLGLIDFRKCWKGTALPTIDTDKLKSMWLPIPPLAEQKRIVAKIEELLPYIDHYEHAWRKLEDFNKRFPVDMQKALLQMAIQGQLVDQHPEEGTGEELYHQIQVEKQRLIKAGTIKKEKPLPEIAEDEIPFDIPESWHWVSLGSVCINIQYGSSQKSSATGKIAVLRMGNIQGGRLVLDKLVYTSDDNEIEKYPLQYNDLLFNRTNSKDLVGKTAIYKCEIPAIYAGYLVRITPLLMDSNYLNYVMQSQFYWSYCQNVRSDAIGQSNINAEKLKRFIFPLPPLVEQRRIVAKLEELLPLCERLK